MLIKKANRSGILAHTITNKKQKNRAKNGASGNPTLMLKSVVGQFKLNIKIRIRVHLPFFDRVMKYL